MTLPNERLRAIKNTRKFLTSLMIPMLTPRVPRAIRKSARQLLRHFPNEFDLAEVVRAAPEVFGKDK